MNAPNIRVVPHSALTDDQTAGLRRLFNSEYLADYGFWDPERPYGYSPADVHVIALESSQVVAHVGFQVRSITVGMANIVVAGTGGVLVDAGHRSTGLGGRLMAAAETAMLTDSRILFGFLGCREEVVPFYEATGWHRIHAVERSTDRTDQANVVTSTDSPILIFPAQAPLNDWPQGQINLLGTPW